MLRSQELFEINVCDYISHKGKWLYDETSDITRTVKHSESLNPHTPTMREFFLDSVVDVHVAYVQFLLLFSSLLRTKVLFNNEQLESSSM